MIAQNNFKGLIQKYHELIMSLVRARRAYSNFNFGDLKSDQLCDLTINVNGKLFGFPSSPKADGGGERLPN